MAAEADVADTEPAEPDGRGHGGRRRRDRDSRRTRAVERARGLPRRARPGPAARTSTWTSSPGRWTARSRRRPTASPSTACSTSRAATGATAGTTPRSTPATSRWRSRPTTSPSTSPSSSCTGARLVDARGREARPPRPHRGPRRRRARVGARRRRTARTRLTGASAGPPPPIVRVPVRGDPGATLARRCSRLSSRSSDRSR